MAHYGKRLIAFLGDFFASINKTFILPTKMGTKLLFYEVKTLLIFPKFLRSLV